ncbi:MAG: hypothetical protein E7497_00195 [Ruminococcus sp.]|nr:hypothetical protein [Ruminococcus sp.]
MNTKFKNYAVILLASAFVLVLSVWGIIKPHGEFSESERRQLAEFPKLNKETVMSGEFMTDTESFALDNFPLRDKMRTLKAFTAMKLMGLRDNNGVYMSEGYISKLEYPLNTDSLDYASERFENIYNNYLSDTECSVYLSIIPDKNYFLAEDNGYPSMEYKKLEEYMREQCGYMNYIDISDTLEIGDYYKTDTHWRQEKIKDTAEKLASEMGTAVRSDYTQQLLDNPFYGVYYGQLALPCDADEIYYLENDMLRNCKVYNYETDSEGSMYDMEKAYGKDPYEMYLLGSVSLIEITNPNASSDKELIVFRDSFGSSLAPLLAEGYSKITLVDIRYLSSAMLGNFMDFENQDVLFLYSTLVLNNSVTLK